MPAITTISNIRVEAVRAVRAVVTEETRAVTLAMVGTRVVTLASRAVTRGTKPVDEHKACIAEMTGEVS